MGESDEFDKIVEHLDLDLGFLDDEETEAPDPGAIPYAEITRSPERATDAARSPDVDEQFYRRVDHGPRRPWRRNVTIAWIGILGSPAVLVFCTLVGYVAPRSIVAALALVFVASAIYLISQLPERNSGDDGAVV